MRAHLPNALTLANLFCGCCAVLLWLDGQPDAAVFFTAASMVFDYADGLVARALGVSSALGRELDSLADVVSFGVAPATMLYGLLLEAQCADGAFLWCWWAAPAFLLAVFAAYRLGRFNLEASVRPYFIGLSTPACTLLVLGVAMAAHRDDFGLGAFLQRQGWVVYVLIALLSYLMVSHIPMHGLKMGSVDPCAPWRALAFAAVGGLLVLLIGPLGLTVAIVLYILYSIYRNPAKGLS